MFSDNLFEVAEHGGVGYKRGSGFPLHFSKAFNMRVDDFPHYAYTTRRVWSVIALCVFLFLFFYRCSCSRCFLFFGVSSCFLCIFVIYFNLFGGVWGCWGVGEEGKCWSYNTNELNYGSSNHANCRSTCLIMALIMESLHAGAEPPLYYVPKEFEPYIVAVLFIP